MSTTIPLAEGQARRASRASQWEKQSRDSDYPGAGEIPIGSRIGKRLKGVIMNERKGLQKMYGEAEAELDESLKAPIKKGEEMARRLIMEMGCSGGAAIDLTVLTLYDVAILISKLCPSARVYSLGLVLIIVEWMDR